MQSFLDSDKYIFDMSQIVHYNWPNTFVEYEFIDRDNTVLDYPEDFEDLVYQALEQLYEMKVQPEDLQYLSSQGYKSEYLDWLQTYRFDRRSIEFDIVNMKPYLKIKGNWAEAIFWEVPLLAILSNAYLAGKAYSVEKHIINLVNKYDNLKDLKFCEFGTRRRRSYDYQDVAVKVLRMFPGFLGTSNLYLGRKYNVNILGSVAHQYVQAMSAFYSVGWANKMALLTWMDFYGNDKTTALVDTYTSSDFLRIFDKTLAEDIPKIRHDSGSPEEFSEQFTKHFEKFGIDPASKTFLFSDGLTDLTAKELDGRLTTPAKRVYCLGTNLTNDHKLNIVIKLTSVNTKKVCKLSNEKSKRSGSPESINKALDELGIL